MLQAPYTFEAETNENLFTFRINKSDLGDSNVVYLNLFTLSVPFYSCLAGLRTSNVAAFQFLDMSPLFIFTQWVFFARSSLVLFSTKQKTKEKKFEVLAVFSRQPDLSLSCGPGTERLPTAKLLFL